jgi:hypothetical protein
MPHHRSVLLATTLCAALIGTAPAHAAPVDVIATLTPQAIGTGTPFGFSTLPAGPFTATLTFSGPLAPSTTINSLAGITSAGLTGFALTIGTATFGLADLTFGSLATDAAGLVTSLSLSGEKPSFRPYFQFSVPSFTSNVMWLAGEGPCGFTPDPPPQISGPCVAGAPGSVTLSQVTHDPTPVPAPGGLALFGVSLLALGAARRRSLTAAPVAAER